MVLECLETLACFASHFWPLAEILTGRPLFANSQELRQLE